MILIEVTVKLWNYTDYVWKRQEFVKKWQLEGENSTHEWPVGKKRNRIHLSVLEVVHTCSGPGSEYGDCSGIDWAGHQGECTVAVIIYISGRGWDSFFACSVYSDLTALGDYHMRNSSPSYIPLGQTFELLQSVERLQRCGSPKQELHILGEAVLEKYKVVGVFWAHTTDKVPC